MIYYLICRSSSHYCRSIYLANCEWFTTYLAQPSPAQRGKSGFVAVVLLYHAKRRDRPIKTSENAKNGVCAMYFHLKPVPKKCDLEQTFYIRPGHRNTRRGDNSRNGSLASCDPDNTTAQPHLEFSFPPKPWVFWRTSLAQPPLIHMKFPP